MVTFKVTNSPSRTMMVGPGNAAVSPNSSTNPHTSVLDPSQSCKLPAILAYKLKVDCAIECWLLAQNIRIIMQTKTKYFIKQLLFKTHDQQHTVGVFTTPGYSHKVMVMNWVFAWFVRHQFQFHDFSSEQRDSIFD